MLKKLGKSKQLNLQGLMHTVITRFKNDSLFRNSVYLMLSTAIMAIFGFIFWIIAARFYTPGQIGFATALISATVLLSNLSLLGFNMAIVRYLPKHKNPNGTISTAIIFTTLATIVVSVLYLLGIDRFAPAFQQLTSNLGYAVLFVIFMVMVSLNTLTDSVFIAYRASHYNVIVYTFFGLVKIALPIVLISFGEYGIFFAYTGSVLVSLALSLYFMRRVFHFRFRWSIESKVAKQLSKFSIANYISSLISSVPMLVMPILIVSKLGAEPAAYYYMASTVAAILYIIPMATTQALLAEGSHDEQGLSSFVKGASKLIALLMLPAVAFLIIAGHYVLSIFGKTYASSSADLLDIMAVTGVVMSINMLFGTVMRIRHQMKAMIATNIAYFACTMAVTVAMIDKGILWAGWALLAGQVFCCLINIVFFRFRRPPQPATAS